MPAKAEIRHPGSYSELGVRVFRAVQGRGALERASDTYVEEEGVKRAGVLKQSGAEKLLEELKGNLVEGLDPELKLFVDEYPGLIDDVYLELRWNSALRGKMNTLTVFALPTEDIFVEGAVVSLVPKSLWQSEEGKKVLEDIIRHSFENPHLAEE